MGRYGDIGRHGRRRRGRWTEPTMADWIAALEAGAWSGARTSRSGASIAGPCPACGGIDRFNLRPGRTRAVLTHCRKGCGHWAIREAVFPGGGPSRMRRRSRARTGDRPPARAPRTVRCYAAFAERCESRLTLGPRWSAELARRGLRPEKLEAAGWRSIESIDDGLAAGSPGLYGWPAPARRGPKLVIPAWNESGRTVGLRVRALGRPGPVSMAGAVATIYGMDALGAPEGATLHVCEGELDAESLKEAGAGPVLGLPGCGNLHREAVAVARAVRPARVAIWFDGDGPGRSACASLIRRLSKSGLRAIPYLFPDGMDANDALRRNRRGLEHMRRLIEAGPPAPVPDRRAM